MDSTRQDASIGALIRELSTEVSLLFRQEVELAKTELGEKATMVGGNLGKVVVGGAIVFLGALALLAAVITGLGALLDTFLPTGIAVWLAPLIVGAALAFFGYSRMQTALGALRNEGLAPKETTRSLQENKQWIKAKVS